MEKSQLVNLLGSLSVAVSDAQGRAMASGASLNISEVAAVMTLGASPGLRIEALGAVLGLSHSATVRLAGKLGREGYLERVERSDRREVGLKLTAAGRALRQRLVRIRNGVLEETLGALSDEHLPVFAECVSQALAAITSSRWHADNICRLCDETVCPVETCPVECKAVALEAESR